MASLSGIHRPVLAASAVAIASVFADFYDKFRHNLSPLQQSTSTSNSSLDENSNSSSWVSRISSSRITQLSFINRIEVPMPNGQIPIPKTNFKCYSLPALVSLYKSVDLAKTANPVISSCYSAPVSSADVLYRWHLPDCNVVDVSGSSGCSLTKSKTVVVLLGWLGARQKHLKRYADWYTSRGFHVITFTFPMSEVLSYKIGGKAEQDVELLVNHLGDWLEGECGKNLLFHTFSNTGWLTYGVILEKFHSKDCGLAGRIKGCIVDSAPVAAPDPQVWASGFSAAFLKKNSIATKGLVSEPDTEVTVGTRTTTIEVKPAFTEAALLLVLNKLFGAVLSYPSVNRRLTDVLSVLTTKQPSCPQLYIYSSADKVIPADYVESFIEKQQRSGREVRACNFVSTPHVDHFRNDPKLYSSQLTQFLEECVLTYCKRSS